jgi:hypothetical protein
MPKSVAASEIDNQAESVVIFLPKPTYILFFLSINEYSSENQDVNISSD